MNEESWCRPLARLREIAAEIGVEEKAGPLPPALAFAEALLLCPTDDAARALLQRDRAAAATFLEIATFVAGSLREGESKWMHHEEPNCCPFFLPAVMAQEFLEGLRAERPECWV